MPNYLKEQAFRFGTLIACLAQKGCRAKALVWPVSKRGEGLMSNYRVKVDPNLDVYSRAFGARIEGGCVFIPSKLDQVLKQHPIGEDPVTIAGFLASFPSAVSGYLGLSPRAVMELVEGFIDLLEKSGVDVTSARRRVEHPYGARYPVHQ